MSKLVLAIAAVGIVVASAPTSATVVVVDQSRRVNTELSYDGADGNESQQEGTLADPDVPFDFETSVEFRATDADLEGASGQQSSFEPTGFEVSVYSTALVEIYEDTVNDASVLAEADFYVEFTVDVETMYEINGTVSADEGTQGWSGYGIDRIDGAPQGIEDFEAGQTTGLFGIYLIEDMGILEPGTYQLFAYSYVSEIGNDSVSITIELGPATVPVQSMSWSSMKEKFTN